MAERSEFSINPTGSAVAEPEPRADFSGKYPREDGEIEDSDPKRRAKAQDVLFRIVVPSRQIGKFIGKEGQRIQKIRDDTKATIKIADAIAEDDRNSEASKVAAGHAAANKIRFLIAGSQAGSLIGMSGQNIEKLRYSFGATIVVLAPNQLPLCASLLMNLTGDVPTVLKALVEIGNQLRTTNLAADYVTFEMMISESLVGGLIGRNGSNILRIRNESRAMIKVYGRKGEQKHRHIQFGCDAQQVALAKQMVDEYIYSQLIHQAGAQQFA